MLLLLLGRVRADPFDRASVTRSLGRILRLLIVTRHVRMVPAAGGRQTGEGASAGSSGSR